MTLTACRTTNCCMRKGQQQQQQSQSAMAADSNSNGENGRRKEDAQAQERYVNRPDLKWQEPKQGKSDWFDPILYRSWGDQVV